MAVSSFPVPELGERTLAMNGIALSEVLEVLTRRRVLISGSIACGVIAALLISMMLPAPYISKASLLIDPRGLQIIEKDVTRPASAEQSLSLIESEMRVIVSDTVLLRVIRSMALVNDAEFNPSQPGLLAKVVAPVREMLGSAEDPRVVIGDAENRAIISLQKAVKVRREPQSFVVELSVSTRDPRKSQAIATAILQAYTESQQDTLMQATQRAAQSLNGRLAELRQRLETAEQAVETYRSTNGIVLTQTQGAQPRLMDEQAIAEFTTQLVTARAETSRAQARLEMMTKALRSPAEISAMPEAVMSPAMVFLRNQHSVQRQRVASLSASVLPAHPAMRNAYQELQEIERGLRQEIALMVSSAQLEVDRARDNESQLQARIETLKASVTNSNARLIKLRELEREAEAQRAVFGTFLNRARELSEQQSVDSRFSIVISPAGAPNGATKFPVAALIILGALAGGAVGTGLAFWGDLGGATLRGSRRFTALSGAADVLTIPGLPRNRSTLSARVQEAPAAAFSTGVLQLAHTLASKGKLAAGSTVFVTSGQPGIAKSEIALNLALAQAASGARVLLVDADLGARTITRHFEADDVQGLADELQGVEAPWLAERSTGLTILAAGTRSRQVNSVRSAAQIANWIEQTAGGFDLVVIDGPSAASDLSIASWAAHATANLLVLQDGVTTKDVSVSALDRLDRAAPGRVTTVMATA